MPKNPEKQANDAYRQARNKVALISVALPNGIAEALEQCFAHYRTPEDEELRRAAQNVLAEEFDFNIRGTDDGAN
jgi:hypothetical protein